MNYKIDAAIGTWGGTSDFFNSLAGGNAAGAGEALLKFADNLSALINIYDMRQHFVVLEAAVLKAVEQAKIAFNAIEGAVGNLVTSDQTYQRQHRLGISFL